MNPGRLAKTSYITITMSILQPLALLRIHCIYFAILMQLSGWHAQHKLPQVIAEPEPLQLASYDTSRTCNR